MATEALEQQREQKLLERMGQVKLSHEDDHEAEDKDEVDNTGKFVRAFHKP